MRIDCPFLSGTLGALGLNGTEAREAIENATEIVGKIIAAYGIGPDGGIDPRITPARPITGLVYGRIQSGKTRAMIASTAMAFDNKFRIAVVMTSNINDLVDQTHIDFSVGLPGILIHTKDNDLDREVDNTRVYLERAGGCLLLVCSKGGTSLRNIAKFLRDIGGENYPSIIFDDEGDQASLDTSTRRRSRSAVAVAPSPINDVIQSRLRTAIPRHVYVSVTGTPQAILLQSAESSHRPSFIVMLPPGASYVGGDQFFRTDLPEENPSLIKLVALNEKQQLLSPNARMPPGLRAAILFFVVSASAAIEKMGQSDRGYSFLCHPSLRNDEQATAERRITGFLTELLEELYDSQLGSLLLAELQAAYDDLQSTLPDAPPFARVVEVLKQQLPIRRLLVINTKVKRQGIAYGRGFNFLIGGNTLGRGIAIRDLLVTYYVRDSRISQIDTMHQHARMYGYRSRTLAYTRIYIPRHLYFRFRDIHDSDEELRSFIESYRENPATFPVEYSFGLRPTRPGVLDVKKTDTINPNKQIYPNYITLPQADKSYGRVLQLLRARFDCANCSEEQLEDIGGAVQISVDQASELVAPIRTRAKNTWRDRTISIIMQKVAARYGDRIDLRFRTADRTVKENGFIETGTLSGPELTAARAANRPTLWIMSARARPGSMVAAGTRFMYPTFVVPRTFPKLYMFNRGS